MTSDSKTPARSDPDLLATFDLEENVAFLLRRAHARAEALFDEIMQTQLTPRQAALLVASHQHPGATVADLADLIAVDRNTVAEMASRLISRRLLRRERSATDRRAWAIFTTAQADALLLEVLPRNAQLMQEILSPLPVELRQLFVTCLKIMVEARGQGTQDALDQRPSVTELLTGPDQAE